MYNRILNIYYDTDDILIPETEIFELDFLQDWSLKNDIVTNPDFDSETYLNEGIKKGYLPLKNMSKINLQCSEEIVHLIRLAFKDITGGNKVSKFEINLPVGDNILVGNVSNLYGDKHVVLSLSKKHLKYK